MFKLLVNFMVISQQRQSTMIESVRIQSHYWHISNCINETLTLTVCLPVDLKCCNCSVHKANHVRVNTIEIVKKYSATCIQQSHIDIHFNMFTALMIVMIYSATCTAVTLCCKIQCKLFTTVTDCNNLQYSLSTQSH